MRWLLPLPERARACSFEVPEPAEVAFGRLVRATYSHSSTAEWRPGTFVYGRVLGPPRDPDAAVVRLGYASGRGKRWEPPPIVATVRCCRPPHGEGCRVAVSFAEPRWRRVLVTVVVGLIALAVLGCLGVAVVTAASGASVPSGLVLAPCLLMAWTVLVAVGLVVGHVLSNRAAEDAAALRYWVARSVRAPLADELLSRRPLP